MTAYRDPHIREIVLRHLGKVCGEMRHAQVVGILIALLDDDRELASAITAACYEKREEEAPCSDA